MTSWDISMINKINPIKAYVLRLGFNVKRCWCLELVGTYTQHIVSGGHVWETFPSLTCRIPLDICDTLAGGVRKGQLGELVLQQDQVDYVESRAEMEWSCRWSIVTPDTYGRDYGLTRTTAEPPQQ